MGELFPVLTGILTGVLLGALAPRLRLPIAITLVVAFGVLATVLSGEYKLSWGYLLVDIPLVGVSSAVSYIAARAIRRRRLAAA